MSDNHITKQEFWLEFFGNFGRDFGNPQRWFTNNPDNIYRFIDDCTKNKLPAFIGVQPKKDKNTIQGIEKLFFDFDYSATLESKTEAEKSLQWADMEKEVKSFLNHLDELNIKPLVVKTCKGFHVYVFLDLVYSLDAQNKLLKEVYKQLQFALLEGHDYRYIDWHVIGDINRLSRIPLSIHQKTGKECIIVDNQLKQDKIRSLEFFKLYGLKAVDIKAIIKKIVRNKNPVDSKLTDYPINTNNNFSEIRPCFKKAMDAGEMCHDQRLALLLEIYSLGNQDLGSIVEYFKCFNDYNEEETSKQVQWFLDNEVQRGFSRPYKCKTIQSKGWCKGEQCLLFK
jgi:DNA primase catalytic subunit